MLVGCFLNLLSLQVFIKNTLLRHFFTSCNCNFIIRFCTELAILTVALLCLHLMNQSSPAIKSIYNFSANLYSTLRPHNQSKCISLHGPIYVVNQTKT